VRTRKEAEENVCCAFLCPDPLFTFGAAFKVVPSLPDHFRLPSNARALLPQ